jgi:hypothetical protein
VSGYLSGLNHVGSILDNEFSKIKSIIWYNQKFEFLLQYNYYSLFR